MSTARAAGLPLRAVAPLGYDPSLLAKLGPALVGLVVYLSFAPFELNTPAHQQFLTAMRTYTPYTEQPQQEAAVYGWLAADLFLRGLDGAGACPSRQAFIDSLRAVRNYDGGGLLPAPVDLTTNRNQITGCYSFVQVSQDGTRYVPMQPTTRCGGSVH